MVEDRVGKIGRLVVSVLRPASCLAELEQGDVFNHSCLEI